MEKAIETEALMQNTVLNINSDQLVSIETEEQKVETNSSNHEDSITEISDKINTGDILEIESSELENVDVKPSEKATKHGGKAADKPTKPEIKTRVYEPKKKIQIDEAKPIQKKKVFDAEPVVVFDPLEKVEAPSETEPPTPAPKKVPPGPYEYRHYQPFHPCCNKILAMKWDKKLHQKHRQKIMGIKPSVDNSSPKPYIHLQLKLKKVQMDQGMFDNNYSDRLAQIERNNLILVKKMTYIMELEAKDPTIHVTPPHLLATTSRKIRQAEKIMEENKVF